MVFGNPAAIVIKFKDFRPVGFASHSFKWFAFIATYSIVLVSLTSISHISCFSSKIL